jgi:hypothetical protein
LRVDATMRLVAEFRQIASDYRRLAAMLTKTTDKQALELFAIGWDGLPQSARQCSVATLNNRLSESLKN